MENTTTALATKLGIKPQSIRARLYRTGSYFGEKPHTLPNGRLWWDDGAFDRIAFGNGNATVANNPSLAAARRAVDNAKGEQPATKCDDCGANPGELHVPYCDIEPCPMCGGQALTCGCDYDPSDIRRMPWTGEWPGRADCRRLNILLPDDEPDWARLHTTCYWNEQARRWERRS